MIDEFIPVSFQAVRMSYIQPYFSPEGYESIQMASRRPRASFSRNEICPQIINVQIGWNVQRWVLSSHIISPTASCSSQVYHSIGFLGHLTVSFDSHKISQVFIFSISDLVITSLLFTLGIHHFLSTLFTPWLFSVVHGCFLSNLVWFEHSHHNFSLSVFHSCK